MAKSIPPFKILIDTCVWLDLAKDHRQQPILDLLTELIDARRIELVIPKIVIKEFTTNKTRVANEGRQSLSAALRRVREVVHSLGVGSGKRTALRQLSEIDHRLSILGPTALESLQRIERLFGKSPILEIPDLVKLRAAERALDGKAPFHRQRNGIADAILIEMYAELLGASHPPRTRFAFVTHNTKDFSYPNGDKRRPHPDLAPYFSRITVTLLYSPRTRSEGLLWPRTDPSVGRP